jgi:signal transduction histidine kinase
MLRERSGDSHVLLVDLPPSPGQTRLARAFAIALSIVFAALVLFADKRLPRVDAFIPITQTAIFFNDLITAVLLYSQFAIVGRLALSILASGYLLSALLVIPYMATFPGLFAVDGLLGAGVQSTPWIFFLSHAGLPVAVILYALRKDSDKEPSGESNPPGTAISWSIGMVVTAVVGLTLLCTAGEDLLPKVMLDPVRINLAISTWYGAVLLATSIAALAVLFRKRRSVLDSWLLVMCYAWVLEILLATTFISARFSVGWYGSRIFALAAAISVLVILLSETTRLYAHLALSVVGRNQARDMRHIEMDTMAASIAHEIHQPLSAIMLNTESAEAMLSGQAPDIEEARSALIDVGNDARRVREVIDGIRNMFNKDLRGRVLLNPNNLIRDVFTLADVDLRMQGVTPALSLNSELPQVVIDRGQFRQVMLNLILNAVEAMRDVGDRPRVLRIGSDVTQDQSDVVITVEDSGTGVDDKDIDYIFDPFFTTKPTGTGVGLAICKSIVEAHGGRLSASRNVPHGMIFRIYLPLEGASPVRS